MVSSLEAEIEPEIGRGKSGVVTKVNVDREVIARKTFVGDPFADFFTMLSTGAPNHYGWNEDAISCAYYGRRILSPLLRFWEPNITISNAVGIGWDEKRKAYYLDTEFIEGSSPCLQTPFSRNQEFEAVCESLETIREHLVQSGFYGKKWQTDNLRAINNLKLTKMGTVLIDMESGGAQFPWQILINPVKFFRYYLPMTLHFKRPLYDDVDVKRLTEYVNENIGGLEQVLDSVEVSNLEQDISALAFHQERWKSMSKAECGIEFALKKGKITGEQAEYYRAHTNIWAMTIAAGLARKGAQTLFSDVPKSVLRWAGSVDYRKAAKTAWKYVSSLDYRTEKAREYVERRIKSWETKGQISSEEADSLRRPLEHERVLGYLPDFGVHGFIFAASKATYIAPALYFMHLIDEQAGIFILSGGSIARLLYTSARLAENAVKKKEKPYTALALSGIHIIGNLAYPIQILRSGNEDEKKLAEFLIYDFFTTIGRRIPVYGGGSTEHHFNRIPELLKSIPHDPSIWNSAEALTRIAFSAYI
ncbi:hypothetical protein HYU11_05650 [Candidatus Woesearchaeota archaeon]|nr:hypothetical protein [Candidatus Woesearchaeota archaeon]